MKEKIIAGMQDAVDNFPAQSTDPDYAYGYRIAKEDPYAAEEMINNFYCESESEW